MATISTITARQILDCRGNPTVEATVVLDNGITATSSCPSGTSTGKHEAVELRDNDPKRYNGKTVFKAVENINTTIANALSGKEAKSIQELDMLLISLDGTENKSHLGANAILAVSQAMTRAVALTHRLPTYKLIGNLTSNASFFLPKPLCNLINGGLHAEWNLDVQEFLVTPLNTESFAQSIEYVATINRMLRHLLTENGFQPLIADEGGFAPKLKTNEGAFALLQAAIERAGFQNANNVSLGIDAAASNFFNNGTYTFRDRAEPLSSTDLSMLYMDFTSKFHLCYIEDPFAEDDFPAWTAFANQVPSDVIVTGDDLTVTNPKRLSQALEAQAIRGIIIKPNQIGTVSEAIDVVKKARDANLSITVSHRSGETNDDFIADFAVGVGANFVKFGAPVRGERVAKYNRLLAIEKELQTH